MQEARDSPEHIAEAIMLEIGTIALRDALADEPGREESVHLRVILAFEETQSCLEMLAIEAATNRPGLRHQEFGKLLRPHEHYDQDHGSLDAAGVDAELEQSPQCFCYAVAGFQDFMHEAAVQNRRQRAGNDKGVRDLVKRRAGLRSYSTHCSCQRDLRNDSELQRNCVTIVGVIIKQPIHQHFEVSEFAIFASGHFETMPSPHRSSCVALLVQILGCLVQRFAPVRHPTKCAVARKSVAARKELIEPSKNDCLDHTVAREMLEPMNNARILRTHAKQFEDPWASLARRANGRSQELQHTFLLLWCAPSPPAGGAR